MYIEHSLPKGVFGEGTSLPLAFKFAVEGTRSRLQRRSPDQSMGIGDLSVRTDGERCARIATLMARSNLKVTATGRRMEQLMRAFLPLFVFLSMLAASSGAATPGQPVTKPAWQWTSADRIAARFDQAKIRERVVQAESAKPLSSQSLPHAGESVTHRVADVINGREHAELFFPHELFEPLMEFAFVLDDEDYRAHLAKHTAEIGLPVDFWNRLRDLSAPYIDDLRQKYDRIGRLQHASKDEVARLQSLENASTAMRCADRAAALNAARKEFGPAFERLLYTYVAPGQSITYITIPAPSTLIAAEEGCK
jgi:hypothetical protein